MYVTIGKWSPSFIELLLVCFGVFHYGEPAQYRSYTVEDASERVNQTVNKIRLKYMLVHVQCTLYDLTVSMNLKCWSLTIVMLVWPCPVVVFGAIHDKPGL